MSVNIFYAVNPDFKGVITGEKENEIYRFLNGKRSFTKSDKIISDCGIKKNISILDRMVEAGILLRNIDTQRRVSWVSSSES